MLKSKIISLDTVRPKDWALYVCLHEDCFHSYSTDELPRRKNAIKNTVCPKCSRDFFAYWVCNEEGDAFYVNYGKKKSGKR